MWLYGIIIIIFLWLITLSYLIFKTRNHYLGLINHTKKQKLDEILDKLINNDEKYRFEIDELKKEILTVVENFQTVYQKIGIIHFNPYGRTEGEKSFVLALLNAKDSGIIANFIYTHEGLRVYIKKVKEGKGEEHQLSAEELESIKKAK